MNKTNLRHANYSDFLNSELKNKEETCNRYEVGLQKIIFTMDLFMELAYLKPNLPEESHPDYSFKSLTLNHFYSVHFSFITVLSLMERGLYSDAFIIIRKLIENLVKYKYFNEHKNKLSLFELGKERIRFKDMFDYVSGEGTYKRIYKFLSKFTHANVGSGQMELQRNLNNESNYQLIPVFNDMLCSVIINFIMYLLYGYLHAVELFDLYDLEESNNKDVVENYQSTKNYWRDLIENHKIQYPDKADWCSKMDKIVF